MIKPRLKRVETIERLKAKLKAEGLRKDELCQLERAISAERYRAEREERVRQGQEQTRVRRARKIEKNRPHCRHPEACQVRSINAGHCRQCAPNPGAGRRYPLREPWPKA